MVDREGRLTFGYSMRRISRNSSSSTMENGRWRRAHHIAMRYLIREGEYDTPLAYEVIISVAAVSGGWHSSACLLRFVVESS